MHLPCEGQKQQGRAFAILSRGFEIGELNGVADYTMAYLFALVAAHVGSPDGWNNLGWLTLNGYGCDQDKDLARFCFKQAISIDDKNATAMVNLGNTYDSALYPSADDKKKAYKWYKRAAELQDARGLFNVANCLHYGYGIKKNHKKAFKIFKKIYKDSHDAEAAFYLGLYYQEGLWVKKNLKKAHKYYSEAAQDEEYAIKALKRIRKKG